MTTAFDPVEFVKGVGLEIVQSFENARKATTPGLKGNAMEQPIRNKLKQLLPDSIGVGSGCVISVVDGTSRQMDVVLYEKDLRRVSEGDNPHSPTVVGSATCWPDLLDETGGRTPTDHISHDTTPMTTVG